MYPLSTDPPEAVQTLDGRPTLRAVGDNTAEMLPDVFIPCNPLTRMVTTPSHYWPYGLTLPWHRTIRSQQSHNVHEISYVDSRSISAAKWYAAQSQSHASEIIVIYSLMQTQVSRTVYRVTSAVCVTCIHGPASPPPPPHASLV